MIIDPIFTPITSGNLIVRLAKNLDEVTAAQRLRYRIFCEEMGGQANEAVQAEKRDFDQFDEACYHMLVLDTSRKTIAADGSDCINCEGAVVGTYRLMTRSNMPKAGTFYSATEYDLSIFEGVEGEILELGRSCVEQPYRTRPVIQMLWQGIGAFIVAKNIKLMFGCASFHGTNIKEHTHALAYLYHYHLAPANVRTRALPEHYVDMNLMPKEEVVPRAALNVLPPLIKGYLRLGGCVGDGAVLDFAYNTCDVSIIVQTDQMQERYANRYVPDPQ